ncbi:MAG: response regulator transcription factor [Flavobacteriales bacterium]|nr:response regulator transcription factor [Flavobacteriales bacterium]
MINIALADDHILVRKALRSLLEQLGFAIVLEADNGKILIDSLKTVNVDIVLMDFSMPEMNGAETTFWLKNNMPNIKVIALSSFGDELSVLKMIRAGARAYLLKDSEPEELQDSIEHVMLKGYYNSDLITGSLMRNIQNMDEEFELPSLSDRELEFLEWACSELTYKEIADRMNVATRSVDNYRDALFEKLGVKSRVGLVLYAIKKKLYVIQNN